MIRKFVEFIFYSSVFISICAVALCIETNLLLHAPLNKPGLYFFVFGGVMVQYNLHYYVKKTAHPDSSHFEWSKRNRNTHLLLAGAGLLSVLIGVYTAEWHHFIFMMVAGTVSLLYSLPVLPFTNKKRLKDFGLLKIITLVLLWTVITVWFPVEQVDYTDPAFIFVFATRFIFLFALCLLFDIRDIDNDAGENIRTIPVKIGVKRTYILYYILLAAFILVCCTWYLQMPETGHLHAMILSGAAAIFIVKYVKKNKYDIAYLSCIDGMMLMQAVLVLLAS